MVAMRKNVYFEPSVVGLLIVTITFTGCPLFLPLDLNGVTTSDVHNTGQLLAIIQDTSLESPFSYIAMNTKTGDRIGLLAKKDENGNPIGAMGAVLAKPIGAGWVVILGEDGLPAQVISVNGTKIHFFNWKKDAVDVLTPAASVLKDEMYQTVSLDSKTMEHLALLRETTMEKTSMSGAGIGLSIAAIILSLAAGGLSAIDDDSLFGIPAFVAATAMFVNLLLDTPTGVLTVVATACLTTSVLLYAASTQIYESLPEIGISATALILILLAAAIPTLGPPVPVLLSPANGAYVTGSDVRLAWNPSEGAKGYMCQLSRTSQFILPQTSDIITDTFIVWKSMPNDGSIWYWRVRAQNDNGWSSYSIPRKFINGPNEACPDSVEGKWFGSTTLSGDNGPTDITVVFGKSSFTLSARKSFGCTDTIRDIPYSYENCTVSFDGSFQMSRDCYGNTSIQGRLYGTATPITKDKMKVDAYHGYQATYEGERFSDTNHIVFTLERIK